MYENKEIIVTRLKQLLNATRAGAAIEELILNERQDKITILFETGCTKEVNIVADSGIAIIQDVVMELL